MLNPVRAEAAALCDVLVIGGGPAGATIAANVAALASILIRRCFIDVPPLGYLLHNLVTETRRVTPGASSRRQAFCWWRSARQ